MSGVSAGKQSTLPTSDHGESPHGGELVAARGVRDLQDHVPVTALDHLPAHYRHHHRHHHVTLHSLVCVLGGGYVVLLEGSVQKA